MRTTLYPATKEPERIRYRKFLNARRKAGHKTKAKRSLLREAPVLRRGRWWR